MGCKTCVRDKVRTLEGSSDADGMIMSGPNLDGSKSQPFWRLMLRLKTQRLEYSMRAYCMFNALTPLVSAFFMTTPLSKLADTLQTMQAVSHAAGAGRPALNPVGTTPSTGASFAAEFKRALDGVAHMQNAAATQAKAFTVGEPNISLNDVMIDMQKASLAFQTTVQVRNRLVAAYQEVASMPV